MLTRRAFDAALLRAVSGYALVRALVGGRLLAEPAREVAEEWLARLLSACADLRTSAITPVEWQDSVEGLFRRISLEDLLSFIEFRRLAEGFEFPEDGPGTRPVRFPRLAGLPPGTSFGAKIFGLRKGAAIVPHGHRNMVSSHLVIAGRFDLRHYDRVREEADRVVLRPTIARASGPGDASSISDGRDNVHWFRALTPSAFTFDVIVDTLDGRLGYPYRIDFVDPLAAETVEGDLLRVPRLTYAEAVRRYGGGRHH